MKMNIVKQIYYLRPSKLSLYYYYNTVHLFLPFLLQKRGIHRNVQGAKGLLAPTPSSSFDLMK